MYKFTPERNYLADDPQTRAAKVYTHTHKHTYKCREKEIMINAEGIGRRTRGLCMLIKCTFIRIQKMHVKKKTIVLCGSPPPPVTAA